MKKAPPRSSSTKTEFSLDSVLSHVRANSNVILALAAVALCAYGFELWNFNLTIDEEIHAQYAAATTAWLAQWRWAMYVLNALLLPYTIVPFVPLALALVFHLAAVLLLLKCWGVDSFTAKVAIGSVCIAYPGLAFVYTFATSNFGIGFGFFCVALSLFLFSRTAGVKKFLAALPAAFALGVYQGFILVLVAVFLAYLLNRLLARQPWIQDLAPMAGALLLALALYFVIGWVGVRLSGVPTSSEVSQYFRPRLLVSDPGAVLGRTGLYVMQAYTGARSIYGSAIPGLGLLMLAALTGLAVTVVRRGLPLGAGAIAAVFTLALVLVPFSSGPLMGGVIAMRFLLAIPFSLAGLVMLVIQHGPPRLQPLMTVLVVIGVYQFVVSNNRLFGSSYVALQQDRLLGSRLIAAIDSARGDSPATQLTYLEMVGYLDRPATPLTPKIETFGASFFEWDGGNVGRVLLFLKTLGYQGLQPLPLDRRADMLAVAESMPAWPDLGSVKVIGDTVLVKFGPYSYAQKLQICSAAGARLRTSSFCE